MSSAVVFAVLLLAIVATAVGIWYVTANHMPLVMPSYPPVARVAITPPEPVIGTRSTVRPTAAAGPVTVADYNADYPKADYTLEKRGPAHALSGKRKLHPVMKKAYNHREAVLNIILLEAHLTVPEKRCRDCIMKHFLTILGYAEEGLTLNGPPEYDAALMHIRDGTEFLKRAYMEGEDPVVIAQNFRRLRKEHMAMAFSLKLS